MRAAKTIASGFSLLVLMLVLATTASAAKPVKPVIRSATVEGKVITIKGSVKLPARSAFKTRKVTIGLTLTDSTGSVLKPKRAKLKTSSKDQYVRNYGFRVEMRAAGPVKIRAGVYDGPKLFGRLSASKTVQIVDPVPGSNTPTPPALVPPQTTIENGSYGVTQNTMPEFFFGSDLPATFECRIDGADWFACVSPYTLPALSEGPHVFEVRAIGTDGPDPTPAADSFTVDTVDPSLTVDNPSHAEVVSPSFNLEFTTDVDVALTCEIDNGGAFVCASPYAVGPLSNGLHTIIVRATDAAGNLTTVIREFSVSGGSPCAFSFESIFAPVATAC